MSVEFRKTLVSLSSLVVKKKCGLPRVVRKKGFKMGRRSMTASLASLACMTPIHMNMKTV